jgi:hypothetical protein
VDQSDPTGLFCVLGTNPGGGCRGGSEAQTVVNGVTEAAECLASSSCGTPEGLANMAAGLANQATQLADGLICNFDGTGGYCPSWSVGSPFPCGPLGSYQVGEGLFFGVGFLLPGGDEADAADAGANAASIAGSAGIDWAEVGGILQDAAAGKGNFDLGTASAATSQAAGEAWVGTGARLSSDGKTLLSTDLLRGYRSPSLKGSGLLQSNFEWRQVPTGMFIGNGHLTIGP